MRTLGANERLNVVEVFGTDPDLLMMVPQPVEAVLILYPLSDKSESVRDEQADALRAAHDLPTSYSGDDGKFVPKGLYWTKQVISNACGTIGLLHSVANTAAAFPPVAGSFFERFLAKTAEQTPQERALALEDDDSIEEEHQSLASEGCSDANTEFNDNLHFVALITHNGRLYELDGRKIAPIDLGACAPEELLGKSAEYLSTLAAMKPGDLRFNMCAITSGDLE